MAEIKKKITQSDEKNEDKAIKPKVNFRKLTLQKSDKELKEGFKEEKKEKIIEASKVKEQETVESVHKKILEEGGAAADFFKRIPLDKLFKLYLLAILSQIAYAGYDYYNIVEEYWAHGAQESVATYGAFLAVMYMLAIKFYFYGIKKCKKLLHLIILIITPTIFIELANETYLDECKNIDTFNKWYAYYNQGVRAFYSGNSKLSYKLLKYSIEGLDIEASPEKKYLYNKSLIYIYRMEALKGDVKKTLDNYLLLYNNYEKVPTLERAMIAKELAAGYNKTKQYDNASKFVDVCFKILKEGNISDLDTSYACLYEKLIINFVRYEEAEPQEVIDMYNKIYNYYEKLIRKKIRERELLAKLVNILEAFIAKKQEDIALEGYLNILNMVREVNNIPNEKKFLYSKISDLYYQKGKKLEGDIYKQKSDEMDKIINSSGLK
ncbi:MAG: hypothetical protein HQK51_15760 [Oligoflexia bacterium]|nr:hypothetical protein [Oligoflexia bacterium]